MAQTPKVVGALCPDCQTPYIAGKNGQGYCKPCYIKWANENKSQTPASGGTRDYDAENRGKVRHGVLCAFIQGKSVEELKEQMPAFKMLLIPLETLIMGESPAAAAPRPVETPAPIPVIQQDEPNLEDIPF